MSRCDTTCSVVSPSYFLSLSLSLSLVYQRWRIPSLTGSLRLPHWIQNILLALTPAERRRNSTAWSNRTNSHRSATCHGLAGYSKSLRRLRDLSGRQKLFLWLKCRMSTRITATRRGNQTCRSKRPCSGIVSDEYSFSDWMLVSLIILVLNNSMHTFL